VAPRPGEGGEAVSDGRAHGEPTFEEARSELERIVAQLESGGAGLEETIALWERGEELYRLCMAKLDAAKGRIEQVGELSASDGNSTSPA
jgi:exodeoxyribonuclease VII small subunit